MFTRRRTTLFTRWVAGVIADYEKRDVEAAANFARFALDAGIEQVVYLGGLGDRPASQHLRSRLRVGEILRDEGPPLRGFVPAWW